MHACPPPACYRESHARSKARRSIAAVGRARNARRNRSQTRRPRQRRPRCMRALRPQYFLPTPHTYAQVASWPARVLLATPTRLHLNTRDRWLSSEFVTNLSWSLLRNRQRTQPRPGWAPDPLMVGIRSPDGLVVGSYTSHPGVLGSIPKREEPGKTGAPCVKVPSSSRVPAPSRTPLLLPLLLSHNLPTPSVH